MYESHEALMFTATSCSDSLINVVDYLTKHSQANLPV